MEGSQGHQRGNCGENCADDLRSSLGKIKPEVRVDARVVGTEGRQVEGGGEVAEADCEGHHGKNMYEMMDRETEYLQHGMP